MRDKSDLVAAATILIGAGLMISLFTQAINAAPMAPRFKKTADASECS